jgi:hypothetical protein
LVRRSRRFRFPAQWFLRRKPKAQKQRHDQETSLPRGWTSRAQLSEAAETDHTFPSRKRAIGLSLKVDGRGLWTAATVITAATNF